MCCRGLPPRSRGGYVTGADSAIAQGDDGGEGGLSLSREAGAEDGNAIKRPWRTSVQSGRPEATAGADARGPSRPARRRVRAQCGWLHHPDVAACARAVPAKLTERLEYWRRSGPERTYWRNAPPVRLAQARYGEPLSRSAASAAALLRRDLFTRAADRDPLRQRHRACLIGLAACMSAFLRADFARLRAALERFRPTESIIDLITGPRLRRRRRQLRPRDRRGGAPDVEVVVTRIRFRPPTTLIRDIARGRRQRRGRRSAWFGLPRHHRQAPVHLGLDRPRRRR